MKRQLPDRSWKKRTISLFWVLIFLPWLAGCDLMASRQTTVPVSSPLPQETAELITETPVVASSPLPVEIPSDDILLQKKDSELPLMACYDLDEGQAVSEDNPDCDFYISASDQTGLIEFYPRSNAQYSFGQVFWSEPTLQDCLTVENWSAQATALDTSLDYYLCYQTSKAHYGVFFVGSLEGDHFVFDWKTFTEINYESLLPTPEATRDSSLVYFSEQNLNLYFEQSLDVDEGRLGWQGELSRADFALRPGVVDDAGKVLSVRLIPEKGFIYASPPLSDAAPTRQECESLKTYSSAVLDITAEDYYLCFVSSEGHPGYFFIRELNRPLGLRLDWLVWETLVEEDFVNPESFAGAQPADRAALLVDITPGEEGILRPNLPFTKKWVLQNSGSTVWTNAYAIVFTGGRDMEGSRELILNTAVSPGESLEVNLDLVAPKELGTFMGTYMLRNAQGELFGIGENASQPFYNLVHIGPAGKTFNLVKDEKLSPGGCFDFDSGFRINQENPLCDFSLETLNENGMTEISPDYYSSFGFTEVYSARPELSQCLNTPLSSETRFVQLQDWYVCFRTNLGRYGWIHFKRAEDQEMIFDWKLFE